jgi:hypothetical protein
MGKKRPEQLKALRRKKGDQAKDSAESSVSSAFLDWRTILSAKDVSRLRKAYAIPDDVAIRIPGKNEGATPSPNNREVAVYEAMFKAGLTLPLLPMMRELLTELNLAPSQVKPNAWVLLVSFCILWKTVLGLNEHPSAREFLAFYRPANFGDGWCFQAHRQLIKLHESWHEGDDYEQGFFFISSTCWELSARERYFNTQPSVPVVWGEPRKKRNRAPRSLHYPEGSSVEKVSKWAADHPDKLRVDQLLNNDESSRIIGRSGRVNPALNIASYTATSRLLGDGVAPSFFPGMRIATSSGMAYALRKRETSFAERMVRQSRKALETLLSAESLA